ncbi:MAG: hypothetical protein R6U66_07390 [Bacteroidales bacterium]
MTRFMLGIVLVFFFFSGGAYAQFAQVGAGVSLVNGGELEIDEQIYQNQLFGLYLDAQYPLGKHLFLVPAVQVFLPRKESFANGGESIATLMNLNTDLFYYFAPRKKISAYLIGGVNLGFWHIKDQHETSWSGSVDINTWKVKPGLNTGVGVRFALGYQAYLFSQARFILSSSGQLMWTNGVQFTFN